MDDKILAIIRSKKGKFLLLKINPQVMDEEGWYIVTGAVEGKDKDNKEAVRREVEEETGLSILDIEKTDYVCRYEWPKESGRLANEIGFIVTVEEDKPELSNEHLDYKWVDKKEFIKEVNWEGDKKELERIIKDN